MIPLAEIPGSVCAPRGFRAAGVAAGIKPSGAPDVALIVSDSPASAAAVFTNSRVVAAPVVVSRAHVKGGSARGIVVNSGNANACTGAQGKADAERMAELAAAAVGAPPAEMLVASTGVIGRPLPMEKLEQGIRAAAAQLAPDGAPAARAIMTTDTLPKEVAVEFEAGGQRVRIGGIAKGSGMIAPRMATMLAFITTDVQIWPEVLQAALRSSVERSLNCITVDGDTSTNDTVFVLANGQSKANAAPGSPVHRAFCEALLAVCTRLAKELARDGEGATKLVEIQVTGARSVAQARQVGLTVGNSPLVKTALFGNDPNWGRILAAAGRAGVPLEPEELNLRVAGVPLVHGGEPLPFDEATASKAMDAPEVLIELDLGHGRFASTVWTCDFSYDYVRINAEYTT